MMMQGWDWNRTEGSYYRLVKRRSCRASGSAGISGSTGWISTSGSGKTNRPLKTVSIDHPETAASVTIIALRIYTARCKAPRCTNRGRLLLRYANAGGRPISHPVLCHTHAHEKIARDPAGLTVDNDRASWIDSLAAKLL
jgi:hypothetical protein